MIVYNGIILFYVVRQQHSFYLYLFYSSTEYYDYICLLTDCAGDTPLEEAQVDMVKGCLEDTGKVLFTAVGGKSDEEKVELYTYLLEQIYIRFTASSRVRLDICKVDNVILLTITPSNI